MGAKPKAAKTPRGRPKKAAEDQKEQSARFIEAAREFGVDESGKEFQRALNKITRAKPK